MALVTLSDDEEKEVVTKGPKRGKGISELLYFPKVPVDLKGDSDKSAQEIWAIKKSALDLFEKKTKKYDDVAKKLNKAQEKLTQASEESEIESAQKEVAEAQEALRKLIVEDSGVDDKDDLNPLPKHAAKALIECVGFVNKRTYYISKRDLKKVEDAGGRKQIRYPTNLMSTPKKDEKDEKDQDNQSKKKSTSKIENDLLLSLEVALTDSDKGEAAEKLKNEFMTFKTDIAKEWKFKESTIAGQFKTSSIDKYIWDGKIKDFFKSKNVSETCELIDDSIKFFNDNANTSYQKYDVKKDEIIKLLTPPKKEKSTRKSRRDKKKKTEKKEEHKFGHYEWGRVILRTQEIWNATDPVFVEEIQTTDYPEDLESRADLLKKIKAKKLPDVIFDASAGAQIMRYSATAGGSVSFDLAKATLSANYGAESKLSLLDAGADFNVSYPSQSGHPFKFMAPVRLERFEKELIQEGTDENIPDPIFPSASSLPLPSAALTAAKQLTATSNFMKYTHSEGQEILIQVVGHTDAVGSHEDNLKLSQDRAANMYAILTGDQIQFTQNFQSKTWGDAERDMMLLSSYMMTKHPKAFKERFGDLKINDKDNLKTVLKREFIVAVKQYGYPAKNILSKDLQPKGSDKPDLLLSKSFFIPPEDKKIVQDYISNTINFLFSNIKGLKMNFSERLYVDSDIHPIIGQGEEKLKVDTQLDNAENRRISFNLYGVTKHNDEKGYKKIDLGYGRIRVHGQVTAFVGASLAMAGAVELNTYKGAALLVAKKSKEDKDGELTPYSQVNPNETAKAEVNARAFVGAEAQAALSAALEWSKTTSDFKLLASIGGSISGTVGAGIDGEFKIGFDQETSTFQIKMKAQATWGLGGGGSWCLSIGVQQLYDFIILIFEKLKDADFNFLAIFEKKLDNKNEETESNIDVYQLYITWVIELWQQEDYATAIVAAQAGVVASSWFTVLTNINKFIKDIKSSKVNEEKAQTLITNVLENTSLLEYTPPKVKGRMLYMITEYPGFWDKVFNSTLTDHNVKAETAALKVILSVNDAREFKEMMEHVLPEELRAKKITDRVTQSELYIKTNLLSDYEKWKQVKDKSTQLNNKDKAWNSEFIKYKDIPNEKQNNEPK